MTWESISYDVAGHFHLFVNSHTDIVQRYASSEDLLRVHLDSLPNKCWRLHYIIVKDLRRIPTHFIKSLCRLWDSMVYDNRYALSLFVRALKNVLAEYKKAEIYNSDITSSSAHSISPKDFEKKTLPGCL